MGEWEVVSVWGGEWEVVGVWSVQCYIHTHTRILFSVGNCCSHINDHVFP